MELGAFELDTPIGQGAMGEVWRARHPPSDTPAAIKIITGRHAHDPDYRRRFNNEVRSVAALDHPGIIRIYDYGEVSADTAASSRRFLPGHPYLAMELADRGSLVDFARELDWTLLRDILVGILEALGHAHARDIIHRDLKPSNILATRNVDGHLRFKVTDFGLAFDPERDAPDSDTSGDQAVGTPYYMAPEQFRSRWRDFGPWTDLYALGCLAWRLVTGRPPFRGKSILGTAEKHLARALPDFEPRFPVPEAFDRWLARLLEKHPGDRFQCAADALWPLLQMPDALDDAPMSADLEGVPTVDRADVATSLDDLADPETGGRRSVTLDKPVGTESLAPAHVDEEDRSLTPMARRRPPMPTDWIRREFGASVPHLTGVGLELFSLRDFPVIGRRDERDRLGGALRAVDASGTARIVLLRGAAGVGKSRLARWLRERAEEVGAAHGMVATHAPNEAPGDGLVSMIAAHLAVEGLDREETAERIERWFRARNVDDDRAWTPLADLVAHNATSADTDSPAARSGSPVDDESVPLRNPDEIRALIGRCLATAADERPLVVQLDDLQWGRQTLEFLTHLVETGELANLPVLFVGTIRDEALADRPFERTLLDELADEAELLEIPPLTETAQQFLVRHLLHLAPSTAHDVLDRAAGNPLFAIELVRDWIERDALEVTDDGFALRQEADVRMPETLYEVWSDRLGRLLEEVPDRQRAALQLAGALGSDIAETEWRRACEIADLPFPTRLVDRLLRQNLLTETDTGWQLVHSMLRETLEHHAREADRWADLNRVCARTIDQLSGGRASAERVADYYLAAGDRERALDPLLEAVEHRGRRTDLDRAAQLVDVARDVFERADVSEDSDAYATLLLREGRVALSRNLALDRAEQLFEKAIDVAERRGLSTIRADARLGLNRVAVHRAEFETASEHARRALEVFDEHQRIHRGRAHTFLALSLRQAAGPEAAMPHFERADALLRETSPTDHIHTLHQWGSALCHAGDLEQARQKVERAYATARDHHRHADLAKCANLTAEIVRRQGDLAEADRWYERAEQFARLTADPSLQTVLLGRVQTALERETYDRALDRLDRADARADAHREPLFDQMAAAARLHALAGAERWARFADRLDELLAEAGSYRGTIPDIAVALSETVDLARRAGRHDLADRVAETAADLWEPIDRDRAAELRGERPR